MSDKLVKLIQEILIEQHESFNHGGITDFDNIKVTLSIKKIEEEYGSLKAFFKKFDITSWKVEK